ncbi:beta-N-acetylhexosaminidase [Pendulispora albinea]|uniref:Beta-N-acetylhexosaminidase n=1 Tax=Pendulispora albinea TaxID=2741071 RepID=A0ABZ2M968_9BACT
MTLAETCGQMILGGFAGTSLPSSYARALAAGERAGAILFRRNVTQDVLAVSELTASIRAAASPNATGSPIVAVDQEGGRVARLGPPVLTLPPAARLGATLNEAFVERVAEAQGSELMALGFTTSFAPVLDIHTHPDNPVIGDRAFGRTPETVTAMALAFARGLQKAGLFACGKHYPGHGDTEKDSHFDRPTVHGDRARLERVELAPFAAAARAGIAALMTAHVVYPALDDKPATLSKVICTDILRNQLGFRGALLSDDLEMKAVAALAPIDALAVDAVEAGCDLLLICANEEAQARAHEALVRRAEARSTFRLRCEEAQARVAVLRALPMRPEREREKLVQIVGGEKSRGVRNELEELAELAARGQTS